MERALPSLSVSLTDCLSFFTHTERRGEGRVLPGRPELNLQIPKTRLSGFLVPRGDLGVRVCPVQGGFFFRRRGKVSL